MCLSTFKISQHTSSSRSQNTMLRVLVEIVLNAFNYICINRWFHSVYICIEPLWPTIITTIAWKTYVPHTRISNNAINYTCGHA